MKMTPERWAYIQDYAQQVFGELDDVLATQVRQAEEEGLPQIAVAADPEFDAVAVPIREGVMIGRRRDR